MKQRTLTIFWTMDRFLSNQSIKGLSQKTILNGENAITDFIRRVGLDFDNEITAINEDKVFNYIKSLSETNLSLSTKNLWLGHLRVFLYWCMDEEYIKPFKIHLIKGQEQKIKFYTDEEINKLLVHSKNCPFYEDRTYTIICFILSTGARASTVLNLRLEDLNFKEKTVTFTHLKNKSTAILPMSDTLCNVLQNYIHTWIIDDYVFCNAMQGKLSLTALENSLRRYCLKRGVKPRGPHAIRHAFARMYIKAGGDAFSLQQFLTHSSMEMTRKYVTLFSEDLRQSMISYNPLDKCLPRSSGVVRRRF